MSETRLGASTSGSNLSRLSPSTNLLSDLSSGRLLTLTTPLLTDQNVLIGYAIAPEEGYCAIMPIKEFVSICNSIYFQVNTPRTFHGLKRIWEFFDERGLHTDRDRDKYINIHNIANADKKLQCI